MRDDGQKYCSGVWGSSSTRYFYEITPEKILNAVENYGFRCTGRCLSLNSMENRVYEVEIEPTGDLDNFYDRFRVVKFYRPNRWTKEQILEEHQFLFDMEEADIPVAPPLKCNGTSIQKLDEENIYFAVFPKIGGRSPNELNSEQLIRLGRLFGRVHNVGAKRNFDYRLKLNPTTYGLDNMNYLLSENIITPELVSLFKSLVEQICEISQPLFNQFPVQRVHGDAHLGNILWREPDGVTLLDLDDTVFAPVVQDMWLLIQGRDDEARQRLKVFLKGYEEMRSFDRGSLVLIEPLRALRMIHYSAWIAHRRDDPVFQRTFHNFGTQQYWMELVADLQDQLSVIQDNSFWIRY